MHSTPGNFHYRTLKYSVLTLLVAILSSCVSAQIVFKSEPTHLNYEALDDSGLPYLKLHSFNSVITMGVTDMNNDFHDDIVILNYDPCRTMSLNVLYQIPSAGLGEPQFEHFNYFPDMGIMKGMAIADIDLDGKLDVFAGGKHNGVRIYPTNGIDPATTPNLSTHRSLFYLQGCNFIDIDRDGDLDILAANDDHLSEVLYNDSGVFSSDFNQLKPEAAIQNCVTAYSVHASNTNFFDPNSGNYGTVWADLDFDESIGILNPELYISKCKGGTNPSNTQGCTINVLYQMQNTGTYQEIASNWNLDDYYQSWAADFGDVNNDGMLDVAIINHDAGNKNLRILLNNGNSFDEVYTEAIPNSYQVIMEDFNNDGYLDIIITNKFNSLLYENNSDGSFTKLNDWIEEVDDNISPYYLNDYKFISCATGDLDHDGYIDFYADYHDSTVADPLKDALFINQGSGKNFIKVKLIGETPNSFGIGARLHLIHNLSGGLGTQVREIRSGESYGIVCSFTQQFGLASYSDLTDFTLKVFWPAGTTSIIDGADLVLNSLNYIEE